MAPIPNPATTAQAEVPVKRQRAPKAFVYRHYNKNNELLYVGMSINVLQRQQSHLKNASWAEYIWHIYIEPFATREEALRAEQKAIRTELPKYNRINIVVSAEELRDITLAKQKATGGL